MSAKSSTVTHSVSHFRNVISSEPGDPFPPEKGRYYLLISYVCPYSHKIIIMRKLKGLEDIIGLKVLHWGIGERGFRFATAEEAKLDPTFSAPPETLIGAEFLSEFYLKADPEYTGRFTVPLLWDSKSGTAVSNDSADIIRFLNTAFDDLVAKEYKGKTFYPKSLRGNIDRENVWISEKLNSGVYKVGFAPDHSSYETSVQEVFKSLDRVEEMLRSSPGPYLLGGQLTEPDLLLFPTIVRFDVVYVTIFKANLKMIRHDYPAIEKWLRHLYWDIPAFKETVNFEHIKRGYSQRDPKGITPLGPLPPIRPKDA